MEITLRVKEMKLIQQFGGPDQLFLTLDMPTPFPNMGYDGTVKIDIQKGYGQRWTKEALGIEPEILRIS